MSYRRAEIWMVLVATVVVPLAFLRTVRDSFDVTKSVLVAMTGALLAPYALFELWKRTKDRRISLPFIATIVFLILSAITLLVSKNPRMSFFGQYQRYTGLLTILSCAAVATVVATRFGRRDLKTLAVVLVSTQLIVNFYGWLQATDRDPWEWAAVSFGRLVFSTLGNPNTASAFSVITLPLAAYLISQIRHSRVLGLLGWATYTSTIYLIPVYNSFQAYVGLVPLVAALWFLLREHDFSVGAYGIVVVLLSTIGVFFAFSESSLVLIAVLVIGALLCVEFARRQPRWNVLARTFRPSLVRITIVASLGLGAVVVLFFDRIRSEIDGGLLERKYFYRAAIDLWQDAPVLGRGLESFSYYYSQYRPAEHAISLEGSITSSVHSIPLGMFASGGVLLGIAFLVLVVTIAWSGVRRAWARREQSGDLTPWFLTSFAAFLVISLVSVESIHLYFLAGLVMGGVLNTPGPDTEPTRHRRASARRKNSGDTTASYLALASLVIFLATLPITTRFFRADKASIEGMKAASIQDVTSARDSFERARNLAPWEGAFALQYAQVLAGTGDLEAAAEEASRAAKMTNYTGAAAANMALIVLQSGRLDEGLDILEKAVANDPFAPELKRSAADLYNQVAAVEDEQGLTEQANAHRARAAELLAAAEAS